MRVEKTFWILSYQQSFSRKCKTYMYTNLDIPISNYVNIVRH